MSVGSVLGKPGPHTHPSCYLYCLHRARNGQNLVTDGRTDGQTEGMADQVL